MGIKFTYHGVDIEVSDPSEAAALLRELTNGAAAPRPRVAVQHKPPSGNGFDRAHTALTFLNVIRGGGPIGVETSEIAKALELQHTKGIGGRLALINELLIELGFKAGTVYDNRRTAEGRRWKPGRRIDEAIEAIKTRGTPP